MICLDRAQTPSAVAQHHPQLTMQDMLCWKKNNRLNHYKIICPQIRSREVEVEQRIIYKILILTYKSFVDLSDPLYLRELVKKKNKSAYTRLSDDSLLLVVPPN